MDHRLIVTRDCSDYLLIIELCCYFTGAGDLSLWEFSGYQPYNVIYDEFIGDINCIHIVVISLADSRHVQLTQLVYWLNFILARVTPMNPIGESTRITPPSYLHSSTRYLSLLLLPSCQHYSTRYLSLLLLPLVIHIPPLDIFHSYYSP